MSEEPLISTVTNISIDENIENQESSNKETRFRTS